MPLICGRASTEGQRAQKGVKSLMSCDVRTPHLCTAPSRRAKIVSCSSMQLTAANQNKQLNVKRPAPSLATRSQFASCTGNTACSPGARPSTRGQTMFHTAHASIRRRIRSWYSVHPQKLRSRSLASTRSLNTCVCLAFLSPLLPPRLSSAPASTHDTLDERNFDRSKRRSQLRHLVWLCIAERQYRLAR